MDEFIASVYGTGMNEEEKVAANLEEMEKEATIGAFQEAIQEEGIDIDQYSDEQIGEMFGQFKLAYEQQNEEDDTELVKQAWDEADAYGRALAQQEFIEMVKEGKKYPYAKAKGVIPRIKQIWTGGMRPGHQKAVEQQQKVVNYLESAAESAKGKNLAKAERELDHAKDLLKGFKGQARKETAKVWGMRGAAAAPAVGAPAAAGYAAGGRKKKGSYTPFLDSAIEKKAMLIGANSGVITPDGECNINEQGEHIHEPEWAGAWDENLQVKTAFDEQVTYAALQHLETLGYPVSWDAEAEEE
jgi:hypothetical protein